MAIRYKKKNDVKGDKGSGKVLPNTLRIMGIDPGSKTGLSVIDCDDTGVKDIVVTTLVSPDHTSNIDKALHLAQMVIRIALSRGVNFVVIEGYSFASKYTSIKHIEIGCQIRSALYQSNLQYIEVPPKSLKKFVLGVGQGQKNEMMKQAYKHWSIEGTDDQIDAYSLSMFGAALHEFVSMPKTNMTAVSSWKTKHPSF